MKLCINPLEYSHKTSFNDIKKYFGTKFSSIFLLHDKYSFGKVLNEVWYQACDLKRFIQQTPIYILQQTHEYHLSHVAGQQMIAKKQTFFSFCEKNATKLGSKN